MKTNNGNPIKKCLTYYGENISEKYYRVQYGYVERNQVQRAELENGECEVNNETLAFLRAYCAYQQLVEVLEEKKLAQFFLEEGRNKGNPLTIRASKCF